MKQSVVSGFPALSNTTHWRKQDTVLCAFYGTWYKMKTVKEDVAGRPTHNQYRIRKDLWNQGCLKFIRKIDESLSFKTIVYLMRSRSRSRSRCRSIVNLWPLMMAMVKKNPEIKKDCWRWWLHYCVPGLPAPYLSFLILIFSSRFSRFFPSQNYWGQRVQHPLLTSCLRSP